MLLLLQQNQDIHYRHNIDYLYTLLGSISRYVKVCHTDKTVYIKINQKLQDIHDHDNIGITSNTKQSAVFGGP